MEPAAETAPQSLMTQDDAASALVTYIFSGVIGSPKDKGVSYCLLEATDSTFSWIAALEEEESTGQPIDRYRVDIDRLSRRIQTPMPISLSEAELQEAILAAKGHHVKAFSRKPHSRFVIILVGADEVPFAIQKYVLCALSLFYREELAAIDQNGLEFVCKLPDTDVEAFGCLQNFIYTGQVYGMKSIPDSSVLLHAWKLAKKLKMAHLQTNLLDCMVELRYQTGCIPSVKHIKEAWGDTEEGCPLRINLIDWMAKHMRDSREAAELARSIEWSS